MEEQLKEYAIRVLISYATKEIDHLYNRFCPDYDGPHNVRDPRCPVCKAIMVLENDLGKSHEAILYEAIDNGG